MPLPISGIVAGLIGLGSGAPSLRIKGFYLAMATIAIHFVIMWLIPHLEITGKTQGLHPPAPQIGSFAFDSDEKIYYIIVTVMLLMTYGARNMVRTRVGRAFVAIRDNDLAAEVMGIELYRYKLLAFFISCFYAGIAGSLWAHWIQVVHPEQFTLLHALNYIGMLIVGGGGSIPGVFFGVIFLRLLDEGVMFAAPILATLFPWKGKAGDLKGGEGGKFPLCHSERPLGAKNLIRSIILNEVKDLVSSFAMLRTCFVALLLRMTDYGK